MPSAGSRSARGRRRCSACSTTLPGALPDDRPRYLMGVGKPDDIVGAVARGRRHVRLRAADPLGAHRAGADPARARSTCRNARHAEDPRPLDPDCGCPACRSYQPRLPAPRGQGRRDHRRDAADLAQPALLSGADGRAARSDRGAAGSPASSPVSRRSGPGETWRKSDRTVGASRLRRHDDAVDDVQDAVPGHDVRLDDGGPADVQAVEAVEASTIGRPLSVVSLVSGR